MTQALVIGFKEALECSLILLVLAANPRVRELFTSLLAGALAGMFTGVIISVLPASTGFAQKDILWDTLRHCVETALFMLPLAALFMQRGLTKTTTPTPANERLIISSGLAAMGFAITVFNARGVGLAVKESAILLDSPITIPTVALLGAGAGLAALMTLRAWPLLRPERFFTLPGLLLAEGTLRLLTGGVDAGQSPHTYTIEALRLGLQGFLSGVSLELQDTLMLTPHEFIPSGAEEFFAFLSGDSLATTILVILLTTPPVLVLLNVFSRPDPHMQGIKTAAKRRLRLAFFRKEIFYKGAPPLLCFFLVLGALHTQTASLNAMTEPRPAPIAEDTAHKGELSIPVAGPYGDLSDGMLRKFSYRYGNKSIHFIVIMKPNGSVGVGLDECEICDPPQWNQKAQGYAQRGDHLVCKYCMTPIPLNTINRPGGCNPIPLPFKLKDKRVVIQTGELIRIWRAAKELDKKGSHL